MAVNDTDRHDARIHRSGAGGGTKRAKTRPHLEEETERQRRRREADHPAKQADRPEPDLTAEAIAPDPTLDSLELLFARARRHPLLTAEEEIELAQRIERGDLEAKEKMINSNLRLVISQARRYQGQGLSMGDLVQEGMLGLIRAVEKFDWRRGFKFSTYGVLWIRQSIQRGVANSGSTIRIPVHVGQRERKVKAVERELALKLSREPTEEEIAEAAGLPEEQVREARDLTRTLASLDQPIGEDGDTALGDMLASERPLPEEEVAESLADAQVRAAVGGLPEAERDVVARRFGLAGSEPRSLRETGAELGISAERARQLEERALKRLAERPELHELREAA